MRASFRALLAALFSIGLLLTAGTGPATADEVTPENAKPLRFISYNVCGAKCELPAKTNAARSAWVSGLVEEIDTWDSDLVMLQELCYGQWKLIRDALSPQWRVGTDSYDTVWGASLAATSGCEQWDPADRRFGLAIFSKGTGSIVSESRSVTFLPEVATVPSEDRILLCAQAGLDGRVVRACNTHIDPHNATTKIQVEAVAKLVEDVREADEPVVLAGDFNQRPEHENMNVLYNHGPGSAGLFQEVDENDKAEFGAGCLQEADRCRSGEATASPSCSTKTTGTSKIDYLFLSYKSFKTVQGDALPCTKGLSDHHLLRGAAAWEPVAQ
ncbi:endonuclease/exonuclease/phosphatase family protein [Streptomyces sp. SBC-4]|nr:endonuclease/exonuclease/phosphatase family protein [Streptomyces sp. SBC-4]MDV5145254.1 endonuclease/exonuclease/phosphatase family protein [Streptomyces sp. SBC-4]